MEYFLKEFNIIRREFEILEKRKEKFNIFSTLHKNHDERRLHSRFISTLLQINGTHGQRALFTELFLSLIEEIKNFPINKKTFVYPKETDKKENSNIDILLINRVQQRCIIIENKIFAGDSNISSGGQIERYINHVVINENIPLDNIFVIYLTLDAHEPSIDSVGEKYKDFNNILIYGYQDLIIPWLKLCLKEVSEKPFLRESIVQYKQLVEKMTGDSSSKEERLAYKELIGSSEENMKSAKKFYDNFKHIKWHAVHEFWFSLQNRIIDSPELELIKPFDKNSVNASNKNECITALTHYEIYRKGQRKKQLCTIHFKVNEIIIRIRFSPSADRFYFGIPRKENESMKLESLIDKLLKSSSLYKSESTLWLSKTFNKNIKFNNFKNELAFSLISPVKNEQLVEETWNEVKELIDEIKDKSR